MKQSIIYRIISIVLCASLFSFSMIGGESFTIHLNDKLIVQHHITSKAIVPSISLEGANANDQLSIYYNECGRVGKDRKLSIQDEKGGTLKEWRFANASNENTSMTCNVKDILAFKKNGSKLTLYYASQEVSKARLLGTIAFTNEVKARR